MRDDPYDTGGDSRYEYTEDDAYGGGGRRWGGRGNGFWDFLIDYIRSRRTEHWIMFLAGAIVGAIIA